MIIFVSAKHLSIEARGVSFNNTRAIQPYRQKADRQKARVKKPTLFHARP